MPRKGRMRGFSCFLPYRGFTSLNTRFRRFRSKTQFGIRLGKKRNIGMETLFKLPGTLNSSAYNPKPRIHVILRFF